MRVFVINLSFKKNWLYCICTYGRLALIWIGNTHIIFNYIKHITSLSFFFVAEWSYDVLRMLILIPLLNVGSYFILGQSIHSVCFYFKILVYAIAIHSQRTNHFRPKETCNSLINSIPTIPFVFMNRTRTKTVHRMHPVSRLPSPSAPLKSFGIQHYVLKWEDGSLEFVPFSS